jgi:hypothetical protein
MEQPSGRRMSVDGTMADDLTSRLPYTASRKVIAPADREGSGREQ